MQRTIRTIVSTSQSPIFVIFVCVVKFFGCVILIFKIYCFYNCCHVTVFIFVHFLFFEKKERFFLKLYKWNNEIIKNFLKKIQINKKLLLIFKKFLTIFKKLLSISDFWAFSFASFSSVFFHTQKTSKWTSIFWEVEEFFEDWNANI